MKDIEAFEGKRLDEVLKDIYDNSTETRIDAQAHIVSLAKLIKKPEDAAILGPIIAQYMEIGVKSNETLVKLAGLVQKITAVQVQEETGGGLLSEKEKEQLLSDANDTKSLLDALNTEVTKKIDPPQA